MDNLFVWLRRKPRYSLDGRCLVPNAVTTSKILILNAKGTKYKTMSGTSDDAFDIEDNPHDSATDSFVNASNTYVPAVKMPTTNGRLIAKFPNGPST